MGEKNIFTNLTDLPIDIIGKDHGTKLSQYKMFYQNYHGIISSFVCIFGLTCNLFNIIVLTRPLMRSSTNMILTSLAISDLIKMLFVLPAVILFYCLQSNERKSEPDFTSRFQVTFYMIQMLMTLTLHCYSTWLTVLLAGFRYVFLSCKQLKSYVATPDRALIGVISVVVISTLLCIPSYIEHRIVKSENVVHDGVNMTFYRFEETPLSQNLSLRDTIFVLHGVVFKLIPCILLLLFSFLLIQQLRVALINAERLQNHKRLSIGYISTTRTRGRRRENENRRTTLMLIIVCVLFLITELPQGAILLLTFISKSNGNYYYDIYQQLGDTFDILALINNSINFILYCLMSRAFRDTFKQIFCFNYIQQVNRRESTMLSVQMPSNLNKRESQADTSVNHELLSTSKCSNHNRTRIKPIENTSKKKKTTLHFLNNSSTIPLINDGTKVNC